MDKLNEVITKAVSEAVKGKVIKEAAKETAKEVIQELRSSKMIKNELSYFKKVELLLYNYNNLQSALKQKDEDIEYIKKHGLPEKSGSIVVYQTSGGNISGQDRYLQLIEKYELEKMETLREINRIENALEKIKDDRYYKIIELKYLAADKYSEEEIAEELERDRSTITRNKGRLINTIKTILFPESIREFSN